MIFEMYFIQELNLKEIAAEFHVTESRASQLVSVIKSKLQSLNEGADLIQGLLKASGNSELSVDILETFTKGIKRAF